MKNALIFGVSGQDGTYLAKLLLNKGYSVYGTSRDAELATFANHDKVNIKGAVNILSANPADFRSVLVALKTSKADEVYNLAGQSSVGLSFEQPTDTFSSIAIANSNLLEAIRFLDNGCRYYNACSSECYGNTELPATEQSSFYPRSPYAVAKAAAFWQTINYREAYGLYACSGILFNHESPLRPQRFVTQKIVRAACRIASGSKEILKLGNISIARDWGWAPEYVEAMWLMLQQDQADDFIIATGHSCTLAEFIECTFSILGLNWHDHVQIDNVLMRPTDIEQSCAVPHKAETVLNWKAKVTVNDVIKRLINAEIAPKILL